MLLVRPFGLVCALMLIAGSASAERLVFLPTGERYADGEVRTEWLIEGNALGNRYGFVGFGFLNSFSGEIRFENGRNTRRDTTSFDLSYNLLPAIPDAGFGISVGVLDVTNQSRKGRSGFVALTARFNNFESYNSRTSADLTIGLGTGRFDGIFIATRIPIVDAVRLLAEHDSQDLLFGLEFAPMENLKVRWVNQRRETLLGLSYTARF